MIGYMTMPSDFRYKDVFLQGQPRHENLDKFSMTHPPMDCGKRAKIFSPFDALKGFSEAVAAKEVLYVEKHDLDELEAEEMDRRLNILRQLTWNSRIARANQITVTVRYFVPCSDENHEAYGTKGSYVTITGTCWKVGRQRLLVGDKAIPLLDIDLIEADRIFDESSDWTEAYAV